MSDSGQHATGGAQFSTPTRGSFQDLPLILEHADPTSQLGQLGALLGRQSVAVPGVDLGLADPLAKRLERDPEIAGDDTQLGSGLASQTNGLNLNSGGHGGLVLPPNVDSFPGPSGPSFKVSTESGQDQRTG